MKACTHGTKIFSLSYIKRFTKNQLNILLRLKYNLSLITTRYIKIKATIIVHMLIACSITVALFKNLTGNDSNEHLLK